MSLKTVSTLASGSSLACDIAPWQVAARLRWQLAAELKKVNLDFTAGIVQALLIAAAEPDKSKAKSQVLAAIGGEDLNTVKNLMLQLVGSPDLEGIIFECLSRCTLNNVKITMETFESEGARADFYEAALEVLKTNITPFFGRLLSTLRSPGATATPAGQR
jgi:hypothetical protein